MGCSKDSPASLTAVRRGVQSLLFALFFAGGSAALAQTLTLTPEQIAQLQALSDEERAALFSSATGQTGSATQAPVTNPVVVEPRDVRPAQSSNSAILDNAVQSGQAQQRDLDEQFTPLSAGQPAQAATDQADAPGASAAERVERAPLQ